MNTFQPVSHHSDAFNIYLFTTNEPLQLGSEVFLTLALVPEEGLQLRKK